MDEILQKMARFIQSNPNITVRELASLLGYAEERSVYYWLNKARFAGIRDFRQAVLTGRFNFTPDAPAGPGPVSREGRSRQASPGADWPNAETARAGRTALRAGTFLEIQHLPYLLGWDEQGRPRWERPPQAVTGPGYRPAEERKAPGTGPERPEAPGKVAETSGGGTETPPAGPWHKPAASKSAFLIRIESAEYVPWLLPQDVAVVDPEARYEEGCLTLLQDSEAFPSLWRYYPASGGMLIHLGHPERVRYAAGNRQSPRLWGRLLVIQRQA